MPELTGPYKKTQPLAGFLFIRLCFYLKAHGNPARSVNSWTSQTANRMVTDFGYN